MWLVTGWAGGGGGGGNSSILSGGFLFCSVDF